MKILLVSPPWYEVPPHAYGGIELVVALLADSLVDREHEVTLFATGDSNTKAKLRYVFEEGLSTKLGMTMFDVLQVSEAHKIADQFDIVHDHSGFTGVAFADRLQVPLLHTLHGPFTADTSLFYSHFKDACYFNAISEYQRSCLPELNYVDTVYNAIDVDNYEVSTEKDDYLILVSRISASKGVHLAIQVAKELGEKLVLVGKIDPVDAEYFAAQVEPEIDGEQIVFLGEVNNAEKRELVKRAKCFVFPIQWPEPFGLVMAEAMACGTPVVAMRNGSAPEVVKHGETGFIVDTLNEMVDAIRNLDTIDPKACREHVLKNFSPQVMAENYEKNYMRILKRHGQPTRHIATF